MPARKTTMEIDINEEGILVNALKHREAELIKQHLEDIQGHITRINELGWTTDDVCDAIDFELYALQRNIKEMQKLKHKLKNLFKED